MKDWSECRVSSTVYAVDPIEFEDENGKMQKTKPYQKCVVSEIMDDCVAVYPTSGIGANNDFYFYFKESNPGDLMTTAEYKLYTATEESIWRDLKPFIKKIESIQDTSADLKTIFELIKSHSKKKAPPAV